MYENLKGKRLQDFLKLLQIFDKMLYMKTLYDVQQLLKQFGIIVYMGKRLYDIEVMAIELEKLYDNGLVERHYYLTARLILRREHRIEEEKEHEKETFGD